MVGEWGLAVFTLLFHFHFRLDVRPVDLIPTTNLLEKPVTNPIVEEVGTPTRGDVVSTSMGIVGV
jgi:hypothetical protein